MIEAAPNGLYTIEHWHQCQRSDESNAELKLAQ